MSQVYKNRYQSYLPYFEHQQALSRSFAISHLRQLISLSSTSSSTKTMAPVRLIRLLSIFPLSNNFSSPADTFTGQWSPCQSKLRYILLYFNLWIVISPAPKRLCRRFRVFVKGGQTLLHTGIHQAQRTALSRVPPPA